VCIRTMVPLSAGGVEAAGRVIAAALCIIPWLRRMGDDPVLLWQCQPHDHDVNGSSIKQRRK
jgi:hypothetical protein